MLNMIYAKYYNFLNEKMIRNGFFVFFFQIHRPLKTKNDKLRIKQKIKSLHYADQISLRFNASNYLGSTN